MRPEKGWKGSTPFNGLFRLRTPGGSAGCEHPASPKPAPVRTRPGSDLLSPLWAAVGLLGPGFLLTACPCSDHTAARREPSRTIAHSAGSWQPAQGKDGRLQALEWGTANKHTSQGQQGPWTAARGPGTALLPRRVLGGDFPHQGAAGTQCVSQNPVSP